jgi:hypothetical protein
MLALILGAASSAVAQITIVGSFDNGVSGVGAESWTRYRNDSGQAIRLTRHEWGGEYGFGYDRTITEDVANGAEWTDSHRSYWLDWTGEIGEQHVETLGWEYIETWSWEYWWGAWYDTSAWGPDTDTVPWGTSFTQSKSQRRDKYGRERSSLGNVRNDNTLTDQYETQTVYKEATGTQIVGVSFSVGPTTFTYNGGAQGPNANPNPSNASYFTTWSAGGMPTTPGSYWVRFDGNAGAGYSGTSGNIGFTINKADQAGVTHRSWRWRQWHRRLYVSDCRRRHGNRRECHFGWCDHCDEHRDRPLSVSARIRRKLQHFELVPNLHGHLHGDRNYV